MTTTDTYLLAEGVLLCLDNSVIVVEGLLQLRHGDTDCLRKLLTVLETLHETTADVVLAMPLDLVRCLAVEHKADGVLRGGKYVRRRSPILSTVEHEPCRSPTFCQ